ncbi:MAG: RNA-binding protein [Planctomycetota bacterium]
MNIFVGNMSFSMTEDSLRALFEEHGEVTSAKIITSRETGRPRGFGFVEMSNDEEAKAAMSALDGKDVDGRELKVNEAQPKTDRGGGDRGGPPRRDRW